MPSCASSAATCYPLARAGDFEGVPCIYRPRHPDARRGAHRRCYPRRCRLREPALLCVVLGRLLVGPLVLHMCHSPSLPFAGLLGETMKIAEKTQSAAKPGTIRCSDAARAAYLASAYRFDAEDDSEPLTVPFHALATAIFPLGDHPSGNPDASLSATLELSGVAPCVNGTPAAAFSSSIKRAAPLDSRGAHQTSVSSDGGGGPTHHGSAEAGKDRFLTFTVRLAGVPR